MTPEVAQIIADAALRCAGILAVAICVSAWTISATYMNEPRK